MDCLSREEGSKVKYNIKKKRKKTAVSNHLLSTSFSSIRLLSSDPIYLIPNQGAILFSQLASLSNKTVPLTQSLTPPNVPLVSQLFFPDSPRSFGQKKFALVLLKRVSKAYIVSE